FGDSFERVISEAELHVLVLEQLLVLTRDRVARLRQDLDERRLVQLVERSDDWQAADEFGNEAVLDQVLGFDLLERRADLAFGDGLDLGFEAECLLANAAVDDLVKADEGAA